MGMRKELWSDLSQIHHVIGNSPWLLSGDFNAVLGNEEKLGGVMLTDADILDFRSFTEICQLSHLKTLGCFYTWNNKQDSATRVWSRLDRSLVNDSWIQNFNSSHAEYLLPSFSDHSPGLISIYDEETRGKNPFKFYKMWINHSSFLPTVSAVWQSHIGGYKMFSVNSKLKLLKGALKNFNQVHFYNICDQVYKARLEVEDILNQVHFYNICDQVYKARLEVEDIQKKLQIDPLNPALINQEKCSISSYNKLLNCELSFFKQKTKIAWSLQGDRSTSYFHSVIKSNMHHNRILVLYKSSGERITEPEDVANELISFFKNQMGTAVVTTKPDINIIKNGYRLNDDQASYLAAPVSKDEIRIAVFSLSDNKSPGPDGFSASFYKSTWHIIGEEVTNAIEEFFTSGKLLGAINSTSLTLIPKVNCPKSPSDFRPISCCNCIYKFISKIIANRIKSVLGCLINEAQCAFVKGRQISNNILLAHELVKNYGRKSISPRIMLNIDIKKAFDTISWSFLEDMLNGLGFPKMMITWIMACITSPRYSISLNGTLYGYFKGERGLRQESYAGRLQIIKSVILGTQVFWTSCYVLPVKVLKRIDELCRNFLWGRTDQVLRPPLVSWDKVCTDKTFGGLGIFSAITWNMAAVLKTLWSIHENKESMWIKWVHGNYIKNGDVWNVESKRNDSWLWRQILKTRNKAITACGGIDNLKRYGRIGIIPNTILCSGWQFKTSFLLKTNFKVEVLFHQIAAAYVQVPVWKIGITFSSPVLSLKKSGMGLQAGLISIGELVIGICLSTGIATD
ncbi:uncharacterized protein LOC109835466 [Asparagus officinalis]|uniref:uncharacterized protein LOC109835466 n=1 Tax=Asparagus officinalis TaxID=4686 RepID=UPI00098E6A4A|nr:uncharacterized protein LOC109835466 [Asparagus officinalis]